MGITREIVKNQAMAFAVVRRLQQARRRGSGAYDVENVPEYAAGVYAELRERLEAFRPIAGSLLEIGPGGNLAVAGLFAANGIAQAVCIDIVPWETASDLYDQLGIRDALERVDYRWPVAIEQTPFDDESFDFVVSHAAFEHFRDPAQACREIARILKPGGVTAHEVDLRDHRDFDAPLDFLRYPEWLWRLMVSRRTFATNRWRLSDLEEGFASAGLEILSLEVSKTVDVDPAAVEAFQPRFRAKVADDLAAIEVFVTATKR